MSGDASVAPGRAGPRRSDAAGATGPADAPDATDATDATDAAASARTRSSRSSARSSVGEIDVDEAAARLAGRKTDV